METIISCHSKQSSLPTGTKNIALCPPPPPAPVDGMYVILKESAIVDGMYVILKESATQLQRRSRLKILTDDGRTPDVCTCIY